jgi:hypothetical protein
MNQNQLFHDTIYDALGADIAAAGGFKVVAGKLWPAESPTTSAQKLRNAINPEQPHKLCPDEVLQIKRLAQDAGSSATVKYEADQLGYVCTWVSPEDEAVRTQRRVLEAMDQLQRELRRSNDLLASTQQAKLRAVR